MDEIDKLIEDLKNPDVSVRRWATYTLGIRKDVRSVPALITALDDRNCLVREDAAKSLGEIKDVRSVSALIQALNDWDSLVEASALQALIKIIIAQNSIQELDKIRKCLLEFAKLDRNSANYKVARDFASHLLIILNARKNKLTIVDIQLDPRIKSPKKPEGGTYRIRKLVA